MAENEFKRILLQSLMEQVVKSNAALTATTSISPEGKRKIRISMFHNAVATINWIGINPAAIVDVAKILNMEEITPGSSGTIAHGDEGNSQEEGAVGGVDPSLVEVPDDVIRQFTNFSL